MGCSKSTTSSIVEKPVLPSNLVQPCSELQNLEYGTGKVLLVWAADTVAKYNDCKARHAGLVKATQ